MPILFGRVFFIWVLILFPPSALAATEYLPGSGWQSFIWTNPSANNHFSNGEPFTFSVTADQNPILTVTDSGWPGEKIEVYNHGVFAGFLTSGGNSQGCEPSSTLWSPTFDFAESSNTWSTGIWNLAPGDYELTFRLASWCNSKVDINPTTWIAAFKVDVDSPPNVAPVVEAGPDQTISLSDGAMLSGTVTDDGLPDPPGIVTTTWSQVSGPGTATFANASATDTTVTFDLPGEYVLRLTANDGSLSNNNDMRIATREYAPGSGWRTYVFNNDGPFKFSVTAEQNPVLTVTDSGWPGEIIEVYNHGGFAGFVTSPVGTAGCEPSSFLWSPTFDSAASSNTWSTGVWDLPPGDYELTFKLTQFCTSKFDINPSTRIVGFKVETSNIAPTVDAGSSQNIALPNIAALDGTVSDDGLPNFPGSVTTTWTKVSGPGIVTFGNASSVDTTASFSEAGTYVLQLTASDGALSASANVTIIVRQNQPPSVNAVTASTIALPNAATLNGTVTDDGLPSSPGTVTTTWSKISGPGTVTFGNPNAVDTTATFNHAGVYVLRLTANDGLLQAFTDLSITVTTKGVPTLYDLDNDGTADLVWRHTSNGVVAVWLMNGTTISAVGFIGGVPSAWKVKGIGDVSGDGKADVIWQHANGVVAVWLMNGANIGFAAFVVGIPLDWEFAGVGDTNGDGKADLVWRNKNSGQVAIWIMNNGSISSSAFLVGLPLEWDIAGMGDVNNDGKADVIWRNNNTGAVAVWLMTGTMIESVGFPGNTSTDWKIKGVGDVNEDGKSDLIWQNDTNHIVAIWLMNGTAMISSEFLGGVPPEWKLEQISDTNGDGKADVVWQHTSGTVAVWLMNGTVIESVGFPGGVSPEWEIQP